MSHPAERTVAVGRILCSSSRGFVAGCRVMQRDIPAFGALVRAPTSAGDLYGLIHDIAIRDDLLVRRLVMADPEPEVVLDQQRNRQVPIEVGVLAVGYRDGERIVRAVPLQPPVSLDMLYQCDRQEVMAFTGRFDHFRLVLDAPGVPADALLAAHLRLAAAAYPPEAREEFLVRAGRELARLLAADLLRLEGILWQIRPGG